MRLNTDFELRYSSENRNTHGNKGNTEQALMGCPQAFTFYQQRGACVSVYCRRPNRPSAETHNIKFLISTEEGVQEGPPGASFRGYPETGDAIGWVLRQGGGDTIIIMGLDDGVEVIFPRKTEIYMQPTGSVSDDSPSILSKKLDVWVPAMTNWLETRGHWASQAATDFGKQKTPSVCTEGVHSLDFQGVRDSPNGIFWIDLQAQSGSGSNRWTYGQVMIQTRIGRVADGIIIQALQKSLKGGGFRGVIREINTHNLPNTAGSSSS